MNVLPSSDQISKQRLRLWLNLFAVTRAAEGHLREFLRLNHHTTLPRFDVMAALYRHREPVTMSALSRMLLVSNGNATTVVDRLEKDGLVKRSLSDNDRRTVYVTLTNKGFQQFECLASDHEREVNTLLDGLSGAEVEIMTGILKRIGRGEKT